MNHQYAGFTDVGANREINQDSILMLSNGELGLFCVADGMGGHLDGGKASRTIVDNLNQWWIDYNLDTFNGDMMKLMLSLEQYLENANKEIISFTPNGQICGSTAVVLLIYKDIYGLISIGDSRVYLKRGFKISQLTVDQTWENQPGNYISDHKKKQDLRYGKLVNAVGCFNNLNIFSHTDSVKKNSVFALCSDGIYKYVNQQLFRSKIRRAKGDNLESILVDIKKNVYDNGAGDNLSLILIHV